MIVIVPVAAEPTAANSPQLDPVSITIMDVVKYGGGNVLIHVAPPSDRSPALPGDGYAKL
jgi:hypothetical protein